ncbi:MAG: START domain-containing protein [Desulfatibacillum sp.]|nr:START domain-containing protein [Desulfatibacillum sp.]
MNRAFIMCAVFLACFLLGPAHGAEVPWKLSKDDNGVRVYSRPVKGSDLLEFEAMTEIPASLSVLGAVLADVPSYPQWMSNCREASIITELDANTLMVYYVQTLPWPIANRDVVLKASTLLDEEKGCLEVLLQAAPDSDGPSYAKRVRMTRFSGRLFLEATGENLTRVSFRIMADPAGSLPSSGVNAGALNVPYRTLLGMKEMARKEKYVEAAREYMEKHSSNNE